MTDSLASRINMAMGREPVDLLVTDARVLNVFSGEIQDTSVAVGHGRVVGFGDFLARRTVSAGGLYLLPGLIDAHVHIESTMVSPREFARCVLVHGTTTVVADPHEIANVLGADGIRYILDATRGIPLDVRVMLPSCVPATPFENAGAVLRAKDLAALMDLPGVLGLGEMMNYPGVVNADPEVLAKLRLAREAGRAADGHSPGLSGRDLQAYVGAGILTDHECASPAELAERVGLGMYVLLREGSATRNLVALLPGVTEANERRCLLCTDDREPSDVLARGHLDHSLRLAVAHGLDPLRAVRMGTLNTAQCYGLADRGAVAPGYRADFFLVDDLAEFRVREVYAGGELVARDGECLWTPEPLDSDEVAHTVRPAPLAGDDLALRLDAPRARVIGLVPDNVLTTALERDVVLDAEGLFHAAANPGLVKLAVIERHRATGNVGLGILSGYGLAGGAIATTVAHDSHNIVAAGDNDADMHVAVRDLVDMGGGITMVRQGRVLAHLPLPIAGLMSDRPVAELAETLKKMIALAHSELCVPKGVQPFMNLSFLSLPVIPDLKLTDGGLFDVRTFSFVPVSAG
ncbi:adenine deaminase [Desulfocurvus sp. DL9XJH121]